MYNAGDFTGLTETVMIPFNTFDSNDPSESVTLTNLANTDVYIYKDASLTERNDPGGVAVDVDIETGTGTHWLTIDLSDNTDAGFYVAGSRYLVRVEGVTVDGGTVNGWVGGFSIGIAQQAMTAALVAHNLDHFMLTATAGADMTTEIGDNTALSRILANGDTSVFVPSTDGLQPVRDEMVSEHAALPTAVENRIEMDSNSTQLAAIVADTGELQTDDIPGVIAALNDLSDAEANAEMVDVMATDTHSLPGQAAPPLAPTYEQVQTWLYKILRNAKTNDGSDSKFMADDESTVDSKQPTSEAGGTVTVGEMVSGP